MSTPTPTTTPTPTNSSRQSTGKISPPISYPKQFNSPRSATSVVKDLLGGGATLVYDSLTQENAPHNSASLLQHHYYPNHHQQQQRREHVRVDPPTRNSKTHLTNHNHTNKNSSILTGRSKQQSDSFPDNRNNKHTSKSKPTKHHPTSVS